MSGERFYVQCVSGNLDHIMEAIPGSELEAKCRKRAEAGSLDALCLGYDDCPECVEDRRTSARRDAEYFSLFGCPMADLDDKCQDDCPCKNREATIVESPYADQVRYITTGV